MSSEELKIQEILIHQLESREREERELDYCD